MGTPHIAAEAGDFAPDVLMPGDPRRARRIADLVLEENFDIRRLETLDDSTHAVLGYLLGGVRFDAVRR